MLKFIASNGAHVAVVRKSGNVVLTTDGLGTTKAILTPDSARTLAATLLKAANTEEICDFPYDVCYGCRLDHSKL